MEAASQHGRLHTQAATENKRKGTDDSFHAGSWELTVEEGIEVLITVEIKAGVFTTGAVCFRGKAHLETEQTMSGREVTYHT